MNPDLKPKTSGGDPQAAGVDLDSVLLNLRRKLLRILLVRGVEENLAEDLVQEGLVAVWRKLPQLRDPERIQAWATSILLNRLRTHLSRQRLVEEISEERPSHDEDPLDAMIHEEADQALDRILGGLKPEHREAITLRHAEGLPLSVACTVLGVPKEILRRRLHSGLARLRRRLAPELAPGGALSALTTH
jgi:RNA polymerase sigma-70 factor (ECF subfamily)